MEHHAGAAAGTALRDVILGGQDGLVNVLGVILAIAVATSEARIVIIAGLAATFAESVSMAAVAYTSTKAARDFYRSEREREQREIETVPEVERKEVRNIYFKKGFRGGLLGQIVSKITSDKKLWLELMMREELGLSKEEGNPGKSAFIVGVAAIAGSLVPLAPFLLLAVREAIVGALLLSVGVLFFTGVVKGRLTTGRELRSGLEMALIGIGAALVGFGIGAVLGAAV